MDKHRVTCFALIWSASLSLTPADGEVRLCNGTQTPVVAALGFRQDENWTTLGWIRIEGGRCHSVTELDRSHAVHIFGRTVDGAYTWGGSKALCTLPSQFVIRDGWCGPGDRQLFAPVPGASGREASIVTFRADGVPALDGAGSSNNGMAAPMAIPEEIEALRSVIDRSLPTTLNEAKGVPFSGFLVRYSVHRGPVRIQAEPGGFRGTIDVYYSGSAVRQVGPALMPVGSCGQDTPRIVEVAFRTLLSSTQSGGVTAETIIESLHFINRCRLSLLRVDVTDRLGEALHTPFAAMAASIDATLAGAVP